MMNILRQTSFHNCVVYVLVRIAKLPSRGFPNYIPTNNKDVHFLKYLTILAKKGHTSITLDSMVRHLCTWHSYVVFAVSRPVVTSLLWL